MINNNLITLAIKTALAGNWKKATELNLEILKKQPDDLEALLRLAKAYEEVGEIKQAQKTYRRATRIDKFNPIAKRGLIRLQDSKKVKRKAVLSPIKNNLFLEEPGKTKTVSLLRLAPAKILLKLDAAEEIKLTPGKRSISVRNKQNNYLGRIPDDLSQRLIKLINRGNQYLAVVKAVEPKMLQIFIKEVKKSKKNAHIPSFSVASEQYQAFLPKKVIREKV